MQAFFSPLGRPEQSLTFRNALILNPEACHVALNSAIRDATGSPSDRQLFNSGLGAYLDILIPLYIDYTFFGNIDTRGWYPTSPRAKKILRACKEGLYTQGIEGLFMAYGGLRAVVALLACVRGKEYGVVAAIVGISSAQRVAVVKYVKQRGFAGSLERWLEEYKAAAQSPLCVKESELPRLEDPDRKRGPNRKRSNVTLIQFEDPVPHEQQKSSAPPTESKHPQPTHVALKWTQLWSSESKRGVKRKRSSPTNRSVGAQSPSATVDHIPPSSQKYNMNPTFRRTTDTNSARDLLLQHHNRVLPYNNTTVGPLEREPTSPNAAYATSRTDSLPLTLFNHSRVSESPSLPQALLVSENLFYNIKVYFENSCRNMILDDHGTLLTPNGAKLHNGPCNDFDSYCFTATMLREKGLHVEFRRALSKASALVEKILRAEHPRTLACFLEVFIHLIQTGLPEVTSFLRSFIKRMSAKVTRNGHPWGQICQLLGELDSQSLQQALAQAWKCTTNTFDSELGTFSPLAVSVRLDYIKRVYGITNYLEEERLLRDLLAQFEGIPRLPTPRVMLNLAHNLNRQGRYAEAQETTLEVLSLLQEREMYAGRIVEKIESLKIIARSHFNQGETVAAEQTMREAIQMIGNYWGRQHCWVPEFINVLEGWLREWGQEEAANTLRGEIEELIGKDEIDEQLDGVQGLP